MNDAFRTDSDQPPGQDGTLISSDSHVMEPPHLWQERIDRRYLERAPVVITEDESDWWYVDGSRLCSFQSGSQPGRRFEGNEHLETTTTFDPVRPGAYLPERHLLDNAEDGVFGSVLYPTICLTLYGLVADGNLLSAIFHGYNEWIAEFCAVEPGRLKGVAIVNLDDVAEGVSELAWARDHGLAGALITVQPPSGHSYDDPSYEPLWAAAQDLDLPLSFHTVTNRSQEFLRDTRDFKPSMFTNLDYWIRSALADIIFGGVLERYPGLRLVSVEHDLAWVPYFLDRLDYTYTQRAPRTSWHRFEAAALPSDFFHRQVFLSFQDDAMGIELRRRIGVDKMMWGSDYPHIETTWPLSRKITAEILAGVPLDEQRKILWTNAAALYGFAAP